MVQMSGTFSEIQNRLARSAAQRMKQVALATAAVFGAALTAPADDGAMRSFFDEHCTDCHDADTHKGNLDLTALKQDFADAENFTRWVKVLDLVESGDMPPKKKARPPAEELKSVTTWLNDSLVKADRARLDAGSRTGV